MWQHASLLVATEIVKHVRLVEGDQKSEDSMHQELFDKLGKDMNIHEPHKVHEVPKSSSFKQLDIGRVQRSAPGKTTSS